MENHQKINCKVHTCKYNGHSNNECLLKDITVTNCSTNPTSPEDSMCGSYRCNE